MEVVDGMHAGQSRGVVTCEEIQEHSYSARCYTGDSQSPRHPATHLLVGSSQNWSVFLGRPLDETPVRCPCNWLATLHGAPRTLLLCSY